MSEFAEKSIQEMLPELNAMKKLGLFSDDEINKILKKRRAHEYKIRRKTKELKSYLGYVEYEEAVLKLMKNRRRERKCTLMVKEIEVGILKRIHLLYQLAERRFQGCIELWMKHINFCIGRNEKVRIAGLFTKALTFIPHNESLWVMAAKYELENNHSMAAARNVLQKSLRANRRSKTLYREYFRMELLNAEKTQIRDCLLNSESTEVSDAVSKGAVAQVVLENAIQEFPGDVEFCLSFVEIIRLFDFAQWIEDKIYECLSNDDVYANNEKAQASVACRCLTDMMIDLKNNKSTTPVNVALKKSYQSFKAITNTNKSETIWELYIELLVDALKTPKLSPVIASQLLEHIQLVCLESIEEDVITESIASVLVDCLNEGKNFELAVKVTPMLAYKFPMNVDIWKAVFTSMTASDACDAKTILDLLEECNKYLSKTSELAEIWNVVINWFMERKQEKMEEIFEISIETSNRELTIFMKEMYMSWAACSKPLQFVRKLFKRLSKERPYSSQLVKTYLETELRQDEIETSLVRKMFDWSLLEFGNSDIDLWMEYIKFESKNSSSKIEDVYTRAIRNLNPGLESQFIERYTLFKCGH